LRAPWALIRGNTALQLTTRKKVYEVKISKWLCDEPSICNNSRSFFKNAEILIKTNFNRKILIYLIDYKRLFQIVFMGMINAN